MSNRYNFKLESREKRRPLPNRIIIGQKDTETTAHVVLKLMGYLLFFRERLQIEPRLHDDNIPFEPDLVQLNYEMHPALWVECGECGVPKLHKLAVKIPDAEIWVVKRSVAEAQRLLVAMEKGDLRRNRYQIVALDLEMFDEVTGMVGERNEITWFGASFEDPTTMQFDFNGLWFDAPFTVLKF
ncbi:MAG TPA: YaeQ family protein [Roseimicrobium sp.]|nr:YaeQ family protein [Roseimicrobium sp.]